MFEIAPATSDNDGVDWRALADRVFPADALRTTRQRTIQWQWSNAAAATVPSAR
jgi:hypothetical protein